MTKDAKTVLYHMYKEYLVKRDNHIPKKNAKQFGSSSDIKDSLFPDWCLEDVDDTLRELKQNGYVTILYGSGTICECFLTNNAIEIMENQKKETLLSVLDFISKFIP